MSCIKAIAIFKLYFTHFYLEKFVFMMILSVPKSINIITVQKFAKILKKIMLRSIIVEEIVQLICCRRPLRLKS